MEDIKYQFKMYLSAPSAAALKLKGGGHVVLVPLLYSYAFPRESIAKPLKKT